MRLVHLSDLHFVNPQAKWKAALKLSPLLALGAGAAAAAIILHGRRKSPTRRDDALLGAGLLAGTGALATMIWPLFTQWNAYRAARASLLAALERDRPDVVVITGDFATLGDPAEFAMASEFLRSVEAIMGPRRVVIAPGNHDAPIPLRPRASQEPAHKLAGYLQHLGRWHGGDRSFPSVHRIGEVSMLALDSVGLSYPFNRTGKVSPDQLERASSIVARPEIRDSYKILCLHYPLIPPSQRDSLSGDNSMVTGDLANRAQVLAWARQARIDMVLCGHVHSMYDVADPIPTYCAGSTPDLIHRNAPVSYRVFDLHGGRVVVDDRKLTAPELVPEAAPT